MSTFISPIHNQSGIFEGHLDYRDIVSEVRNYQNKVNNVTYSATSFLVSEVLGTESRIREDASELAYYSFYLENHSYSSGGSNAVMRSVNPRISHVVVAVYKGLLMMNAMGMSVNGMNTGPMTISQCEVTSDGVVEKYSYLFDHTRIIHVRDIAATNYFLMVIAVGRVEGSFTGLSFDGEDQGNTAFIFDATTASYE
jgi:hypothetical protein